MSLMLIRDDDLGSEHVHRLALHGDRVGPVGEIRYACSKTFATSSLRPNPRWLSFRP